MVYNTLIFVFALFVSYIIGSIPFGLVVVRIGTGRDVLSVGSGRTGGTNAMRAGGFIAGLITALLDVAKGASTIAICLWLMPDNLLLQVLTPIMVILGHNYSIFLPERNEKGKIRLRGGAGGASALGGAIALWPPAFFIIFPLAVLVFVFVGYASITTMSIAFFATLLLIYRAATGASPWIYVLYGVIAELLLLWALRPNIKRLKEGNERSVGLRAYLEKRNEKNPGSKNKKLQVKLLFQKSGENI